MKTHQRFGLFRDDQKEERKRRRSRSSEMTRKRRGPRTPPESPPGSPSDGDIDTVDELERRIAPTQEALEDRLINSSKKQLSLMIAIACDKSIRPLVNYLCEKEAAGVVSVPGGVLYVFAPSNMADRLVHACAPRVNLLTPECSHLLFALALKASSNTPSNGS
uniref:SPOC domain-containing protein n=1 Tax=Parascaris equorum TaxID=6256 RepID=A0A914RMQ5_PAREQ